MRSNVGALMIDLRNNSLAANGACDEASLLRAGTQELVSYRLTRSRDQLEGMAIHYGVIITFVAGAIIGSRMIALVGLQAILASPVLLAIALALMFWDREGAGNSLTGVWAAGEAAAKRQRRD